MAVTSRNNFSKMMFAQYTSINGWVDSIAKILVPRRATLVSINGVSNALTGAIQVVEISNSSVHIFGQNDTAQMGLWFPTTVLASYFTHTDKSSRQPFNQLDSIYMHVLSTLAGTGVASFTLNFEAA